MPRKSPIRIRAKDRELIQKLNRSVSAKKSRLSKNYGVSTPEIQTSKITSFNTRAEFNTYVEQMQSFTNRYNTRYQFVKNKNDVVIPKRQYNQIQREIASQNRQRAKAWKQLEKRMFSIGGKKTDMPIGLRAYLDVAGDKYGTFRPKRFNFNSFGSAADVTTWQQDFLNKAGNDWKNYKNELYKANYMKAIETVYGRQGDYLVSLIEQASPEQVVDIFYTDEYGEIDFVYDFMEQQQKLDSLVEYWEGVVLD